VPADWTDTELAYLAGFIDGEGSIAIFNHQDKRSGRPCYKMWLNVYNTDENVMGWIAFRFGGKVTKVKRRTMHNKQQYSWNRSGRNAAEILKACLPYFKVKRQQAEIFIEVAATIRGWGKRPVSADVLDLREIAAQRVRVINRGGR